MEILLGIFIILIFGKLAIGVSLFAFKLMFSLIGFVLLLLLLPISLIFFAPLIIGFVFLAFILKLIF